MEKKGIRLERGEPDYMISSVILIANLWGLKGIVCDLPEFHEKYVDMIAHDEASSKVLKALYSENEMNDEEFNKLCNEAYKNET